MARRDKLGSFWVLLRIVFIGTMFLLMRDDLSNSLRFIIFLSTLFVCVLSPDNISKREKATFEVWKVSPLGNPKYSHAGDHDCPDEDYIIPGENKFLEDDVPDKPIQELNLSKKAIEQIEAATTFKSKQPPGE